MENFIFCAVNSTLETYEICRFLFLTKHMFYVIRISILYILFFFLVYKQSFPIDLVTHMAALFSISLYSYNKGVLFFFDLINYLFTLITVSSTCEVEHLHICIKLQLNSTTCWIVELWQVTVSLCFCFYCHMADPLFSYLFPYCDASRANKLKTTVDKPKDVALPTSIYCNIFFI